MKARMVGDCLFCTPVKKAIKIGDEIIPHPILACKWVHKWHYVKMKVQGQKEEKQLKLF